MKGVSLRLKCCQYTTIIESREFSVAKGFVSPKQMVVLSKTIKSIKAQDRITENQCRYKWSHLSIYKHQIIDVLVGLKRKT